MAPFADIKVNCSSAITFSWVSKIIRLGYKRPLVEDDFFAIHKNDSSASTTVWFGQHWLKESQLDGSSLLDQKSTSNRSLSKVIWRMSRWTLMKSMSTKITYDSLLFLGPFILNRLVNFVVSYNETDGDPEPVYMGLIYVAAMFIGNCIQTVFLQQYFARQFRLGANMRSAMINAIYSKALQLQLNAASKEDETQEKQKGSQKSTGEIVNIMSVDAQRVGDVMPFILDLISAPLQVIAALSMLWWQVQWSLFAGLGAILLLMPLSVVLTSLLGTFQKKVMAVRDERMKITSEMIASMKVIKMYAWEDSIEKKIEEIRNKELSKLWNTMMIGLLTLLQWVYVPASITFSTFAAYTLLGNELTAAKVFTSVSIFDILTYPFQSLPFAIDSVVRARVSVKRIQNFLELPEIQERPVLPKLASAPKLATTKRQDMSLPADVEYKDATIHWPNGDLIVRGLNFTSLRGEITAIVGKMGSGKTGIINNLIGDFPCSGGTLNVRGRIAYCAQSSWIQSRSIRHNITFCNPFNEKRYKQVVEACALTADFGSLADGDQTEIGEKGMNLSGGQKQRIALARAVYANHDVYLLDDTFAAVDAYVGNHIFKCCIQEYLSDKTVILITNNLQLLPSCDNVVFLSGNEMVFCGKPSDLFKREDFLSYSADLQMEETEVTQKTKPGEEELELTASNMADSFSKDAIVKKKSGMELTMKSHTKLIEDEEVNIGAVEFKIYKKYIQGCGGVFYVSLVLIFITLSVASSFGSNGWLSYWTDNLDDVTTRTGLIVYGGILLGYLFFSGFAFYRVMFSGFMAAVDFHKKLLDFVLRAPLQFFESTPSGRIVNRFSKDVNIIDELLPDVMSQFLYMIIVVIATIIVITYSNPLFAAAVIPLFYFYYLIQKYFIQTSRQIQRINSVLRSPIFEHFTETLDGTSTIRAYGFQDVFKSSNMARVDREVAAFLLGSYANRWLAIRLEFIGTCIIFCASSLTILGRYRISPGVAGLAISYALQTTQGLTWMVRMSSERETNIVSVERIVQYSEMPTEAASKSGQQPPVSWPNAGVIEFDEVELRYRKNLPLVLKGITLKINGGEKVGIVGRTGAGKSSILLILLRLVEMTKGTIYIDGIPISSILCQEIRRRLSIIPQDPVLFAGTLRFNLDPFQRYADSQIWDALRGAHLHSYVRGLSGGLDFMIEPGGQNVSMGQKQLICLARALLRRSSILLLDEATSAVDPHTDKLIQDTIREQFKNCTVLTIAHRLNTIVDYDKVLVMDDGNVVEYDSPAKLLGNEDTLFNSLCKAHGKGIL